MHRNIKAKSILYVEDQKDIHEPMYKILKHYSQELYVAHDGAEGLEVYKKHLPQIVITDIRMPKLSGIEMITQIREINKKAHIIICTAYSEKDYFLDAIELSVDGYLIKPIKVQQLIEKLLDLVEAIQLQDENQQKELMLIHQNKLASQAELLKNISHQWRQPLSVITTDASLVMANIELENPMSNEYIVELMESINAQAQNLSKIIDDFSHYYSSYDLPSFFDVNKIVHKGIRLENAAWEQSSVLVLEDFTQDLYTFSTENKLKQVMTNIFNNVKDVFESLSTQKRKILLVKTSKLSNETFAITIHDNGGGVDPKILPQIFDPYFTTKHQSVGTGLGLYIAYNIIKNNFNGNIEISNDTFKHNEVEYYGAKVVLTLPIISNDGENY